MLLIRGGVNLEFNIRNVYGGLDVKSLSPKAEKLIEELGKLQVKDEVVKSVRQDVDDVGEILAISLEDALTVAEILSAVLEEVAMLREEVETLKGSEA